MTQRRLTLRAQIGWAEGMARQHARIASRNPAQTAARARAEEQHRLAEAAVATLRRIADQTPQQDSV